MNEYCFKLFLTLCITLTLPIAGFAQGSDDESDSVGSNIVLTGNVAVTSDYRFRGITQTERQIAVQGGFDIVPEGNWFAGIWASSLAGSSATETDLYAGFGGQFGSSFEYDVRYTYYHYPQTKDYWELSSSISKSGFIKAGKDKSKTINTNLTLSLTGSHNYFGATGGFLYPTIDFSFDLTKYVVMDLHFGYNIFTRSAPGFFDDDTNSYSDWSIGVTTEAVNNAFWTVALVGTDVSDQACYGQKNWCSAKLVLSMSKEF